MAHETFRVEVLTPEGEVFNDEVEMVSTKTSVGSIGVLAHHAPLLAMLDPSELRLYKSESDVVRFAQAEGYLQVANNRALILVEEAHDPDGLDVSRLRDRLSEAERTLEEADEDSERARMAQRDKVRLERFLAIADGS
ncbi:MAG: F-type H+-transporting ATPase subunit epsilon [Solirubrobacteraceae bacterium]|jgi:F-type H+-transporting ATPase subunit epsilon|nr:F-type H+-transporting ATPase subunit epsilon [Solirubrobacteraceae bacterium]